MEKLCKITIILITFFMAIMMSFNYKIYGAESKSQNPSAGGLGPAGIEDTPDYYDPFGKNQDIESSPAFEKKVGKILAIIRIIGIVSSVIALMIIGIKNMTASVEQKSVIKNAMPGYILGVILVVSITSLPSIIYDIVSKM